MTGYVALTDYGWYSFLRDHAPWDEVNFWQPKGGTLLNPPIGTPLFFKLHADRGGRIVGFGYFSWRSRLPAWMAWDSFERGNGALDRASFLRLLAERRGELVDPTGNFTVGCLLVSNPALFSEADSVSPPADWPRTGVQQGKNYDVTHGEGLRMYLECREIAARYLAILPPSAGGPIGGRELRERYGSPYLLAPRLGQGGFRVRVTDAYDRACAITTEHSLPVLEAAHIQPFREGGEHDVRNGLLLRADIHRLFDQGLVTVTPDYRFLVSERLRKDYRNGLVYYDLQTRLETTGLHLPSDLALRPDPVLLDWHMKEKFVA